MPGLAARIPPRSGSGLTGGHGWPPIAATQSEGAGPEDGPGEPHAGQVRAVGKPVRAADRMAAVPRCRIPRGSSAPRLCAAGQAAALNASWRMFMAGMIRGCRIPSGAKGERAERRAHDIHRVRTGSARIDRLNVR